MYPVKQNNNSNKKWCLIYEFIAFNINQVILFDVVVSGTPSDPSSSTFLT